MFFRTLLAVFLGISAVEGLTVGPPRAETEEVPKTLREEIIYGGGADIDVKDMGAGNMR